MLADDYGFYADDTYNDSSSGSGDALNSILGSIGVGLQAFSATQGRTGYPAPAPAPSPIYSSYSANATVGNNSLLWIIVLAVIGFFAFKNL